MTKSLSERLYLKAGMRVRLFHAPDDAAALLEPLPAGVTVHQSGDGDYDFVMAFATDQAALNEAIPQALAAARRDSSVWFCYPKGTSKVKTDINRDHGWALMHEAGWGPVRQVAVDDTWSALQFRPEADVKRKPGSVVAPKRD